MYKYRYRHTTDTKTKIIPFININSHHIKSSKVLSVTLSDDNKSSFSSEIEAHTLLPFLKIENYCLQKYQFSKESHLYSTKSSLLNLNIRSRRPYALINSFLVKGTVINKFKNYDQLLRSKINIMTPILVLIVLTTGSFALLQLGSYYLISRLQLLMILTIYNCLLPI